MKNIVIIAALFALSFATGFTCSKNAPEQTATPAAEEATATVAASGDAAQAQMAAPASGDVAPAAQPATEPAPAEKK